MPSRSDGTYISLYILGVYISSSGESLTIDGDIIIKSSPSVTTSYTLQSPTAIQTDWGIKIISKTTVVSHIGTSMFNAAFTLSAYFFKSQHIQVALIDLLVQLLFVI